MSRDARTGDQRRLGRYARALHDEFHPFEQRLLLRSESEFDAERRRACRHRRPENDRPRRPERRAGERGGRRAARIVRARRRAPGPAAMPPRETAASGRVPLTTHAPPNGGRGSPAVSVRVRAQRNCVDFLADGIRVRRRGSRILSRAGRSRQPLRPRARPRPRSNPAAASARASSSPAPQVRLGERGPPACRQHPRELLRRRPERAVFRRDPPERPPPRRRPGAAAPAPRRRGTPPRSPPPHAPPRAAPRARPPATGRRRPSRRRPARALPARAPRRPRTSTSSSGSSCAASSSACSTSAALTAG